MNISCWKERAKLGAGIGAFIILVLAFFSYGFLIILSYWTIRLIAGEERADQWLDDFLDDSPPVHPVDGWEP